MLNKPTIPADGLNRAWTTQSVGNPMYLTFGDTYQVAYVYQDGAGYMHYVTFPIFKVPESTETFETHNVMFEYPSSGLCMWQLTGSKYQNQPRYMVSGVTWSSFNNQGGFVGVSTGTYYYRKLN